MTGADLTTFVRTGLNPIVIVLNNLVNAAEPVKEKTAAKRKNAGAP